MVPGETTFSYSVLILLSYSAWTRAGALSFFLPVRNTDADRRIIHQPPAIIACARYIRLFFFPFNVHSPFSLFGAFPFFSPLALFHFRNVLPSHAIIPRVLSTFVFAETLWRFTDPIFEVFVLLIHPAFYCALNSRKNCISFFFIYLLSVDLLFFYLYITRVCNERKLYELVSL